MGLEKIGLQGVFDLKGFDKSLSQYLSGIEKANGDTDKAAAPIQKNLAGIAKAVTGAAVASAAAVGAVAGVAAVLGKLAIAAAPLEQIGAAFEGLGGDIEALRAGTLGMVADADLMKSYNTAAQLVSTTFAEQLPEAMQYLSKVAASTGESMDYMVNSLVKGVGRLSPAILDNLQVQASLEEATTRATAMFGKEADQLSKTEQQAGMMSIVMEKLAANTANMPELAGSATQQIAALQVEFKNLADNMGKELLPALTKLLPSLLDLAQKAGPPLIDFATKAADVLVELADGAALVIDVISRGKAAIDDYTNGIIEGATAYDEYVDAAILAEVGVLGLRNETVRANIAQTLLKNGVIEEKEAWEDNNQALLQHISELERLTNMTTVAGTSFYDTAAVENIATQLFDPEAIQAAMQAAQDATAEGLAGMVALQTKFGDDRLKAQQTYEANSAIALAKHNAQIAQLQAAGDVEGMARLQASFDESQTMSEWDNNVKKQLAERAELEQTVIEKRKNLEILKAQQASIRASFTAASIGAIAKGGLEAEAARGMLRILGISLTAAYDTEDTYVTESSDVFWKWGKNVVKTAETGVNAVKALADAWAGDLAAAQAALLAAENALAAFTLDLPPLELPPIPDGFGDAVGGAVADELDRANIDQVFDATLDRVASGLEAMRKLITDVMGGEDINAEVFGQKLDDFLTIVGIAVEKTLVKVRALGVQFEGLLEEAGETSKEINATLAVLGQITNIGKLAEFGDLDPGPFKEKVIDFVNALGVISIILTDKLWNLRQKYGIDVLKEASETAKAVAGALSPLGSIPDLMKLGEVEPLPDALMDQVLDDLGFLFEGMIDVANAAKGKIDDGTKDVVDIMGETFSGLKTAIDTLLTLGGIEEYKSLFDDMGQSDLWAAIKMDIGTLLGDIAGWNLLVDVDAIKGVRTKLDEARAVVGSMLGIVSDITSMREQGGADVGTFRAILTQFSDIVNALGWGGPGVFGGGGGTDAAVAGAPIGFGAPMNQPAMPSLAGFGGAGGNLGTITLRGEFVGPSGDFVTFTEEIALAQDTNINLGQIGSPNYAY